MEQKLKRIGKDVRGVTRRALLVAAGSAGVGSTIAAIAASPPSNQWRAVKSGSSLSHKGINFEAECGTLADAIHVSNSGVVRFQMIPENYWAKDSRSDSERTELDGWRVLLDTDKPMWASWSMFQEPGAASTADWCILQQMMQVRASPLVLVLKPNSELHWAGVAADDKPGQSRVRGRGHHEPGVWEHCVSVCKLDPASGAGFWRVWMNGQQVVNFAGPLGAPGVSKCYSKFGVYRSIRKTWDGVADISRNPEILRVRETIAFRYANMRFTHSDLSHLIGKPEPVPPLEPWPTARG